MVEEYEEQAESQDPSERYYLDEDYGKMIYFFIVVANVTLMFYWIWNFMFVNLCVDVFMLPELILPFVFLWKIIFLVTNHQRTRPLKIYLAQQLVSIHTQIHTSYWTDVMTAHFTGSSGARNESMIDSLLIEPPSSRSQHSFQLSGPQYIRWFRGQCFSGSVRYRVVPRAPALKVPCV